MIIHKAKSAWFSKYGAECGKTEEQILQSREEQSPFDADVNCDWCQMNYKKEE